MSLQWHAPPNNRYEMKKILSLIPSFLFLGSALCFPQWGPDVRLTHTTIECSTTSSNGRSIVSDTSGFLHVAWLQRARYSTRSTLWYRRWRGLWEAPVQLTDSTAFGGYYDASFSAAANNLGEVLVVWNDFRLEIWCRNSTDGGSSWNPEVRLTNVYGMSVSPSITTLGAAVHVVWLDYRDGPTGQVYYKRRVGGAWSQDTALTAQTDTLDYPTVACDSAGRVFVAWWKARNGKGELWFKRYNGVFWDPGVRLSQDTISYPALSNLPSMAVKGNGEIHLFWNGGDDEIYYKHSSDGGAAWGSDVRLTYDPAEKLWPSGGAGPGNRVQVAWADARTNPVFGDIYFKESSDGGQTWSSDTQLTADDPSSAGSVCPTLAVDPTGRLHVVWMDCRDTVYQVYYKSRAPLGIETTSSSLKPRTFELSQNHPNPWKEVTSIAYSLLVESQVELRVYNPMGQLVRTLVDSEQSAGSKRVAWDGRDDLGRDVPSGVYFYCLQAGKFSDTKKMVLIH